MMDYSLILIGILLIVLGLYHITKFLVGFSSKLNMLNEVLNSGKFDDYKSMRLELDELNYSYYEILSHMDDRMSLLESELESPTTSIPTDQNEDLASSDGAFSKTDIHSIDTLVKEERTMIRSLIDQGFKDPEIAKILNVGIGKITLIRKLYHG